MAGTEINRLPETQNMHRARVLLRFGIIDTNPDGQAALFAQACVADPTMCDDGLKQAAQREVKSRFVPPGNALPLYFGGHPPHAPPRSRIAMIAGRSLANALSACSKCAKRFR